MKYRKYLPPANPSKSSSKLCTPNIPLPLAPKNVTFALFSWEKRETLAAQELILL
jgi:hypothetical protein